LKGKRKPFGIVAMAASAGGLTAISEVLAALPADFPVAIVVVQHLDPRFRSRMADILTRRTGMQVKQAEAGEKLSKGTVYIAPPDNHLLVDAEGKIVLTHTELVHFLRPSADLLFESVAASYKERAIGVVLSGTGSDGALGVTAIKAVGGAVIAENYKSAEFSGMPQAAFNTGKVDFVLPVKEIGPKLIDLVNKGAASVPE
jgi:two-component system chemotaxis response regulator CheB